MLDLETLDLKKKKKQQNLHSRSTVWKQHNPIPSRGPCLAHDHLSLLPDQGSSQDGEGAGATVAEPSAHWFPQFEQCRFPKGTAGGQQQAAHRAGRAEGQ